MKYSDTTLADLSRAIRKREITSVSLVEAAFSTQQEWREINAVVTQDADALLSAARRADALAEAGDARGSLHGIPLVVKDNTNTAALPTSASTPALVGNRPGEDAPAVQRLLGAGALLFGKTNMHELAFGITNNHGAFGSARNPFDTTLIPGGSSGGTAAAIAAGIVRAGLGTDTGGSTRIPASFCGICGFRPTPGRYPAAGIVPISHTRDTPGPMARSMADLRLLDAVLTQSVEAPVDFPAEPLRIGVPRAYYYENLEPEVQRIAEASLQRLEQAGYILVEADIDDIEVLNAAVGFPVALHEARHDLIAYLARYAPAVSIEQLVEQIASPDVQAAYAAVMDPDSVPEAVYREALTRSRPALQQAFADYFTGHRLHALAIPTVPVTARPVGDDETIELNGERVPTMLTIIRSTDPSSNAGIPSLTVPAGQTAGGLPVGFCFEGPAGSDEVLLALGARFEQMVEPLPRPVRP